MIALGVDPDLHDLAIAAWGDDGPRWATVLHHKQDKSLTGNQRVLRMIDSVLWGMEIDVRGVGAFAVEGQELTYHHKRPGDIVKLAQVAGAVFAALSVDCTSVYAYLPTPKEWKGSVAKHAHQARLYRALGWGFEIAASGKNRYARPLRIPPAFGNISKGAWRHVGDAILLAKWAYERSQ